MKLVNHLAKVIFVPGNGSGSVSDHWFPYLADELSTLGIKVVAEHFPDPIMARSNYWLPFLAKLGADENTILIGHSTGAVAALRYAETHKIWGSVLVAGHCTDLGDPAEKSSGYFDTSWNFNKIVNNQHWMVQYAAEDDPYVPVDESNYLAHQLGSDYTLFEHGGHLGDDIMLDEFPHIVSALKEKLFI